MKFSQKFATAIFSTSLALSVTAWAQSSGGAELPTEPSPSASDPALDPSDIRGAGNMERGTAGVYTDFASVDSDGNGRISRSEFAASPIGGSMRAGSSVGVNDPITSKPRSNSSATTEPGLGASKSAAELFRELDRDGDGYLTKTEFDAYKATDRGTKGRSR